MAFVIAVPLGPWLDQGAAVCDPDPLNCEEYLQQVMPPGLVADCYSAIRTDLASIVAQCTATVAPQQIGGSAVADDDSVSLAPNARAGITVTITRHGAGDTQLNYTFMLRQNVTGITWDADRTKSGTLGPGDSVTFVFPFQVGSRPGVKDVVFGYVYWDQSGGAHDYLGFNVLSARTPGLDPMIVMVVLAMTVSLIRLRRS